MFKFKMDSGSVAGITTEVVFKQFSARKAELFMLLKTGSFHFASTQLDAPTVTKAMFIGRI